MTHLVCSHKASQSKSIKYTSWSSAALTRSIPLDTIGVHCRGAISTVGALNGTPFYVAGVIKLEESPPVFQHTPHNLGAVLYPLRSRLRVLVTVNALARIVTEAKKLWEETVEKALGVE